MLQYDAYTVAYAFEAASFVTAAAVGPFDGDTGWCREPAEIDGAAPASGAEQLPLIMMLPGVIERVLVLMHQACISDMDQMKDRGN